MTEKLNSGAVFPAMTIALAGGGSITLPTNDSKYQVVLFYRGHW